MPTTVEPVTRWSQVLADEVYTADDVAALFKVDVATVRRWVRGGHLATLPRVSGNGPGSRLRFLGVELLRLLGTQAAALPATETPAERTARAAADREEVRRLVKASPGGES